MVGSALGSSSSLAATATTLGGLPVHAVSSASIRAVPRNQTRLSFMASHLLSCGVHHAFCDAVLPDCSPSRPDSRGGWDEGLMKTRRHGLLRTVTSRWYDRPTPAGVEAIAYMSVILATAALFVIC